MSNGKIMLKGQVPKEWIDYNGHMNDADYVRAFSSAVDQFMEHIGIDAAYRKANSYTIFTLESHICYLAEMSLEEDFEVHVQLLDSDAKRLHLFMELYGNNEKRAATSEQMLMGIDQASGKPAPFPVEIHRNIEEFSAKHTAAEKPKEAGRVIGIKKK